MITRDPGAPFDTPNGVIGRQGRNELTLSFRPDPYLHRLLQYIFVMGKRTDFGSGGEKNKILPELQTNDIGV